MGQWSMCQGLEPWLRNSPAPAATLGWVLSCLGADPLVLQALLNLLSSPPPATAATLHLLGVSGWYM